MKAISPPATAANSPRLVGTSSLQPIEGIVPITWRAVCRAAAISSGRAALDCVQAPQPPGSPLTVRARRLIRQSQISAW